MEPLTASVHLWELGADGWVDWARGWVRGITRLPVESDPAGPSTEFVHFDHMSGGVQISDYNDLRLPGQTQLHSFWEIRFMLPPLVSLFAQ